MALNNALLEGMVQKIGDAESLPATVHRVMEVCEDPDSDARSMAEAVSSDPALSARLVRLANSAFFGLVSKVGDVHGAVVRLGMKGVRNAVMGLGVSRLFEAEEPTGPYSRPKVWKHSVAVAIYCELLAKASARGDVRALAGEAFLVGLVHDIGIILEDQYAHSRFEDLASAAWQGRKPLYDVEYDDLGFAHQDLGAAVLRKWKFPARLADAVGAHHDPGAGKSAALEGLAALSEMHAAARKVGYWDVPQPDDGLVAVLVQALQLDRRKVETAEAEFDGRLAQALDVFSS